MSPAASQPHVMQPAATAPVAKEPPALRRPVVILMRVILIVAGYALAAATAGLMMLVLGFNNGRMPEFSAEAMTLWSAAAGGAVAYAALVMTPFLAAVAVAEVMRIRKPWYYLAVGLFGAFVADYLFIAEVFSPDPSPFGVVVGAGLAAALVYWLIAGWSAGLPRSVTETDR